MLMKILSIVKYDLIKTVRDKTAFIFLILLPVIMIFVFGNINSNKNSRIPSGIVNYDDGQISKDMVELLKKDKVVSFTEMKEDKMIKKVQDSDIELGFVIKKGFSRDLINGKTPQINVIKMKDSANIMTIEYTLRNALAKIRSKDIIVNYFNGVLAKGGSKPSNDMLLSLNQKVEQNLNKSNIVDVKITKYSENIISKSSGTKTNTTVGFMIMFVMMSIVFASSGIILEEKKDNTWDRLMLTPTNRSVIFFGNVISTFVKGWFQVAFLVLFSKFVIHVEWGSSLPALMVLMTIFILCVTGLGIFLSTFVKTNSQLSAIASLVVTCTTMVSGCYWPLELEPDFMQKIAVVFPQYWAMKGMRSVIDNNLGFEAILQPLIIILFIGVLLFVASVAKSKIKIGVSS
ncbi:MAG: ABC transporter permease [Bacillota bacterium]|nr:ABC transporter permease [Bacillota bacterium]